MIYRWQGQTTAVISDTRCGHCLPPLGVCEQAQLAVSGTSEVGKEDGPATQHQPLLLKLPWESTHSDGGFPYATYLLVIATVKDPKIRP